MLLLLEFKKARLPLKMPVDSVTDHKTPLVKEMFRMNDSRTLPEAMF